VAEGDFYQTGFRNCPNENSAAASWIGFGGATGAFPLLQTGTTTVGDASTISAEFVEVIGADGTDTGTIFASQTNPGDEVYTYIDWSPGNPDGTFYSYDYDMTNGYDYSYSANLPMSNYDPALAGGSYLPGQATAEAVDERPSFNGVSAPLRPFYQGTVVWNYFKDGTPNDYGYYDRYYYDNFEMISPADGVLAYTSSYNYNGFVDTWVQCGHWG